MRERAFGRDFCCHFAFLLESLRTHHHPSSCCYCPGFDNATGNSKYLYTSVVSPDFISNNLDVKCDNYLKGDFNYNMEQLVTKKEERGGDGMGFDRSPPMGIF